MTYFEAMLDEMELVEEEKTEVSIGERVEVECLSFSHALSRIRGRLSYLIFDSMWIVLRHQTRHHRRQPEH